MGNPAQYALRRAGSRTVEVRYAHFGAPFLFGDLFWGPSAALATLAAADKSKWCWDSEVDAAFVLCEKTRTLAFCSYQLRDLDLAVVRRLVEQRWPGYTVRIGEALSEISPVVGVDLIKRWCRRFANPKTAEAEARDDRMMDLPKDAAGNASPMGARYLARVIDDELWRSPFKDHFYFRGLVTERIAGVDRDLLSDKPMGVLLCDGPSLLRALGQLPTVTDARHVLASQRRLRTYEEHWKHFRDDPFYVLVDADAQQLTVTVELGDRAGMDLARAHAYAHFWPGWNLVVQRGGLAAHYATVGRSLPEEITPSLATCASAGATLVAVEKLLLGAAKQKREAAAFLGQARLEVASLAAELAAQPGSTVVDRVHPSLEHTPLPTPAPDDIEAEWSRVVERAGLAEERETAAERAARTTHDKVVELLFGADVHADLEHTESLGKLDEALALEPQNLTALHLAVALHATHGPIPLLKERLATLAVRQPDDPVVLSLQAALLGTDEAALALHERAFEREPSPAIAARYAAALLASAEASATRSQADALLQRVMAVVDASTPATSNLAWCAAAAHVLLGELDAAWLAVRKALATHVGDRDAFGRQLLADPQLAALWKARGPLLPAD